MRAPGTESDCIFLSSAGLFLCPADWQIQQELAKDKT